MTQRAPTMWYLRLLKSDAAEPYWRPTTRGDCAGFARPCPYAGCRHHLAIDVNGVTGSIKFNHPHTEPGDMVASCSLDEAERDGMTLEAVGVTLNITRERTRQIQTIAVEKVRLAVERMERAS